MIDMLGLPQANLSQHLALMRRSGLLKVTKKGTRVYYRLNDQKIAGAVFNVRDFLLNTQQLDKKSHHYLEKSANLYPVATDAVCGMRLSTVRSSYKVDYKGQAYFFCASGCKEKFLKTPIRYLSKVERIKGD
jgi:YHS domain-containing protein